MRQAHLLGRTGNKWALIEQPAHLTDQQALFREIRNAQGKHDKAHYDEIQIVTQDGVGNRKHVFETDAQQAAHAERRAADTEVYEAAKKKRAEDAVKAAAPRHQTVTPTTGLVKGATDTTEKAEKADATEEVQAKPHHGKKEKKS